MEGVKTCEKIESVRIVGHAVRSVPVIASTSEAIS